MTSASAVFCTHTPTAPALICILASFTLLCSLACGRQRMLCFLANSAMRTRLRFIASRSITRAGVSMSLTGLPISPAKWGGKALIGGLGCLAWLLGADGATSGSVCKSVVVERNALQVLSVGPAHQCEALGRPEQPVDGRIVQGPGARRLEVQPGGGAVQHVHHAAVADQRNQLAW